MAENLKAKERQMTEPTPPAKGPCSLAKRLHQQLILFLTIKFITAAVKLHEKVSEKVPVFDANRDVCFIMTKTEAQRVNENRIISF